MTLNLLDRITIESGKCGGRPCIRGGRLRVKGVLDLFAAGSAEDEILAEYDFLERMIFAPATSMFPLRPGMASWQI